MSITSLPSSARGTTSSVPTLVQAMVSYLDYCSGLLMGLRFHPSLWDSGTGQIGSLLCSKPAVCPHLWQRKSQRPHGDPLGPK